MSFKLLKGICITGLLCFFQSSFSASNDDGLATCTDELKKIKAEIVKSGSIITPGCPETANHSRVNKIANKVSYDENSGKCISTCYYQEKGVSCRWDKGDWGNTLYCGG